MMTFPVRIDLPRAPWHPTFHIPSPEKYPGQRQAFRRGAWAGDGVKSQSAKAPKRERRAERTAKDEDLWRAACGTPCPTVAFRAMKYGK